VEGCCSVGVERRLWSDALTPAAVLMRAGDGRCVVGVGWGGRELQLRRHAVGALGEGRGCPCRMGTGVAPPLPIGKEGRADRAPIGDVGMLWINVVGSMAQVDVGRGCGSGKRGGSGNTRAVEVLERASHRTPVNDRNLNVLVVCSVEIEL
jgi:hypothetical protein